MGGITLLEEDQCSATTSTDWPVCQLEARSRSCERRSQYEEALQEAREAYQRALEATHRLELDIKRLSQEVENVQPQCPTATVAAACRVDPLIGGRGLQAYGM